MERQKLKHLVKAAEKGRKNRVYYEKYYNETDTRRLGIVQDEQKTALDRVQLAKDANESLKLFGFAQTDGSYFELGLNIASLYLSSSSLTTDHEKCPLNEDELKWRLATVELTLYLHQGDLKLTYKHEQLLNYDEKRQASGRHENRNIYKVGALSIETVLPYSLSRILLNGLVTVESAGGQAETRPVRLTISTHPTCDKFDFKFNFDSKYTCDMLSRALVSSFAPTEPGRLLGLMLEDRIDQPMMFQGHLESLDSEKPAATSFVMWGAKVKKLLNAREELRDPKDEPRDCLFAWTECGQQVHLTRPARRPAGPVYGLVHSSYDYASCLYEMQLLKLVNGEARAMEFDELNSFADLSASHTIKLTAFQVKNYKLEFLETDKTPMKIRLNGFAGWALATTLESGKLVRDAQERLLSMVLSDSLISHNLADEQLLGGKGNSLMQLTRMVQLEGLSRSIGRAAQIAVPRGLVVTSQAYNLWLQSNSKISAAIRKLDAVRRLLAAKSSVCLCPLAPDYLSPGEAQKMLREESHRCCTILKECPLPNVVQRRMRQDLVQLFGAEFLEESREGKGQMTFAVRSSAVGEDSLETSAAGQMRTILDARGFDHICRSIVECWASQFELEALTYKSQNGLEMNLPMAVVVQELVECYAAGVAATCDPLTGNWTRLEITANRGQGEGVVAGRATDTVRVSSLDQETSKRRIEKVSSSQEGECCLTDDHILALSDLLLELRTRSLVKEREVEWGITLNDRGDKSEFLIHLFQSRPLTNLSRLETREIDHELDSGLPCPLDSVSRANLGEVMPGALSPLNTTWLWPICTSYSPRRPYEKSQTRNNYVAQQFANYANMAVMVVTYSEVLRQFNFVPTADDGKEAGESQATEGDTTARDMVYSMIGSNFTEPKDEEERRFRSRFMLEKLHPLALNADGYSIMRILGIDVGILPLSMLEQARAAQKMRLHLDLAPIESYLKRLQENPQEDLREEVAGEAHKLYGGILVETGAISKSWACHILATLTSMSFNTISLKMMCSQPAYKGANLIAIDILNDFSVLMRGEPSRKARGDKLGEQTESGDISKLLDKLLECFVSENMLDRMKALDERGLYQFLTSQENASLKCCRLYADFMKRNGHRAWKEFCLATKTWGDDPSYIMRMLATRLKSHTKEMAERERERRLANDKECELKYGQVDAKLTSGRAFLVRAVLPRARNATIRREGTKSALILVLHKYRLAFRHLGGLMCILGLMPDAQLIFYLTIEEIDEIMKSCVPAATDRDGQPADSVMPRLLYKARRRQQRLRSYDQVTFPKPTLSVNEMFATISEQTGIGPSGTMKQASSDSQILPEQLKDGRPLVRGITSCSGCVTGRACVLFSIDDVDQIQANDILITYSIDISWSVYFYTLAGIVTEVGGIVSHGAVVAREYGLPTLCTAIGACSRFKTGQRVTLDADKGLCYLAADQESDESLMKSGEIPPGENHTTN